jgi:hypothetical protein
VERPPFQAIVDASKATVEVVLAFWMNIMYWRVRARMTPGGEKIGAFSYGDPCEPRSAM